MALFAAAPVQLPPLAIGRGASGRLPVDASLVSWEWGLADRVGKASQLELIHRFGGLE